jgi:large subunit ribosomal protein L33
LALDPSSVRVRLTGSILECTEAAKEGKSPSRYFTTKNKKLQQERLERMKYNPSLRRRTLHKEKK